MQHDAQMLPPELVDFVLDQLRDDPAALIACGLVCRSWLPRTRLHLFRSIILKDAVGYAAFEKLLRRFPYLTNHVRRVVVVKTHSRPSWVDGEMPRALVKLPRVEHLEVAQSMGKILDDTQSKFGLICAA
ncbi:hypothetical protein BKA93DRAFT_375129 [Sparassis latifolia]|uniref:F-box domain-containing protein n=1 Tax=Sparassis crispa TaxID=139825 RepID=A0A401GPK0_9APHY|nr:hypothetical protein SCP_0600680 [Sparassis crispa]GBE84090.1 hypothetical protein SCP_0600680 [Sparassis crispa]